MFNVNYAFFNPNNKPEFNEGSFNFIKNKTSVNILAAKDKDVVLDFKPSHGFLCRWFKCFQPQEFLNNKKKKDEENKNKKNKKKTKRSYSCGISITTDFNNYIEFFTSLIKVLSKSFGVDIENPIINCKVPSNNKILKVTKACNSFFLIALQDLYKSKTSDIWKLKFSLVNYKAVSSSLPI